MAFGMISALAAACGQTFGEIACGLTPARAAACRETFGEAALGASVRFSGPADAKGETFRGGPTCARVRFDGDAKGRLPRVRSDDVGEILFFFWPGVSRWRDDASKFLNRVISV